VRQLATRRAGMRALASAAALALILGAATGGATAAAGLAHRASKGMQRAPEPPREYTAHVTGSRQSDDFNETWSAEVIFELVEVEDTPTGRIAGLFYYPRSGTVRWRIAGGGDCPWRDEFTFRVTRGSGSGFLRFEGLTRYAAIFTTHDDTVTAKAREYDDGGCVDVAL
jgi:hypothetical protein